MSKVRIVLRAAVVTILGALALAATPQQAEARRAGCWYCVDSCPLTVPDRCPDLCDSSNGQCLSVTGEPGPGDPGYGCEWDVYMMCDEHS